MPFFIRQVDVSSSPFVPQNVTVMITESAIPKVSFELTGFVYKASSKGIFGDKSSARGSKSPVNWSVVAVVVGLQVPCFL